MYISGFKIWNYKSYNKPQELRFEPGFNIIIGQNDAGKTALLEGIGLALTPNPHRSLKTLPTAESRIQNTSGAELKVSVTPGEIRASLKTAGTAPYTLPLPEPETEFCNSIGFTDDGPESLQRLVNWITEPGRLEFTVRLQSRKEGPAIEVPSVHEFELYPARKLGGVQLKVDEDGMFRPGDPAPKEGWIVVGHDVAQRARERIYRFSAERRIPGRSTPGTDSVLWPNAENLAQVMDKLMGDNPPRFRKLSSLVRQVFPHVNEVTVARTNAANVEIQVWTTDPSRGRPDLAIPLAECGTGIGQVLAILYVVVNSDFPQVIAIDEPQSFLHPGAVRRLIQLGDPPALPGWQ